MDIRLLGVMVAAGLLAITVAIVPFLPAQRDYRQRMRRLRHTKPIFEEGGTVMGGLGAYLWTRVWTEALVLDSSTGQGGRSGASGRTTLLIRPEDVAEARLATMPKIGVLDAYGSSGNTIVLNGWNLHAEGVEIRTRDGREVFVGSANPQALLTAVRASAKPSVAVQNGKS